MPEERSLRRLAGRTSAGRLPHCDRNTSTQRHIRSQTGCGSSRQFHPDETMRPECEHASVQTCDESERRDHASSAYYLGRLSPQSCDRFSLFTFVASVRGMKNKYSSRSRPSIRHAIGQPCSSRQYSLIRSDHDDMTTVCGGPMMLTWRRKAFQSNCSIVLNTASVLPSRS